MTGPTAGDRAYAGMTEAERRVVEQGVVLRGREGWLFLDSDVKHVLRQHTGELRLSSADLENWRVLLESRAAWLAGRGVRHVLAVAPDPHAVYPEMLPEGSEAAADRPVLQLIRHLRERGSEVRVLYPLPEMLAEKRLRPVYSETDSHWNFLGAFVEYEAILTALERSGTEVRRLARHEVCFGIEVFVGGLGFKLEPQERSPQVMVRWMPKKAQLAHDNCILNHGSLIELRCPEAPDTTCLLLGDSFCLYMTLFMAESFGRFVWAHTHQLDFELVERYEADCVVQMMGERFLIDVPYDLPFRSVDRMAAEKRAAGELRREMNWWGA